MADVIDYRIFGDDMQLVEVELDPGEGVRAETGTMLYMGEAIRMSTSSGGGIMRGLQRMVSGESFFIAEFVNEGRSKASIAFAAPYPGKIIPLDLHGLGGEFLCAARGIEVEVAFTRRFGAGIFGGEGFILQRLTGRGLAFIHAGGTVVERELYANEVLRVDTGCIVGLAPTVDYDIETTGGIKNALFGGEGLFLAKLTGPGKVLLQSLPFSRLADRVVSAANFGNQEERRGGLLGSFITSDR